MTPEDLENIKKRVLVLDIETAALDRYGRLIDIKTHFDDYVKAAECKWIGIYSYRSGRYHLMQVAGNEHRIKALLQSHDFIVGHNIEDFDFPIVDNNKLIPPDEMMEQQGYDTPKRFTLIDTQIIMGQSVYLTRSGQKYKNRGVLMGYKFKKNSLAHMAEVMGLNALKGDIDYHIFIKDSWTDEEKEEIRKYLKADVQMTKEIFDKLWEYWLPFTEFLDDKNIRNLSWIRSSIASLTYKAACNSLGVVETYGDVMSEKEEVGGRVIEPRVQEARNMYYCDVNSLYPHNYAQFNLFNEVEEKDITPDMKIWHGDELFKVEGYYDISEQHKMAEVVGERLKQRMYLKKHDPTNPKVYALKIFLNSLYGAQRSAIFENIYTPNGGGDCCRIGQTIHRYMEQRLDDMGFDVIMGDTDGVGAVPRYEKHDNDAYVEQCLKTISDEIKSHAPFPLETFGIGIDFKAEYIMFPFSLQPIQDDEGNNIKKGNRLVKKLKGKKKNYLYIRDDGKIKIMGMPIIKDNATQLGPMIFEKILTPLILSRRRAKFTTEEMDHIVDTVMKKPGAIDMVAQEYKVKKAESYKNPNQIQAQISKEYFNGDSGVINLIKNKKVGRVGKGKKYATIEEIHDARLKLEDIDLEKLRNELEPFIEVDIDGE